MGWRFSLVQVAERLSAGTFAAIADTDDLLTLPPTGRWSLRRMEAAALERARARDGYACGINRLSEQAPLPHSVY
jgi:hypothetical protein